MNIIWLIVRKDCRCFRWQLGVWTLLLVAKTWLGWTMFSPASVSRDWFDQMNNARVLLAVLDCLLCYVLAALFVLEDAPQGAQVFWATRPLSGLRLLGAKLLGVLAIFMVWPLLVALPWWLACGFAPAQMASAALNHFQLQAIVVGPAFLIASLTGTGNRFVVWSLVVFMATSLSVMGIMANSPARMPDGLVETRIWLAWGAIVVTGTLAVILQYRTRRTTGPVALAVTGAAIALLIGFKWQRAISDPLLRVDHRQLSGTEPIILELTGAKLSEPKPGEGEEKTWVSLNFVAKQVPAKLVLLSGDVDLEFRWPDGSELRDRARLHPLDIFFPAWPLLGLTESEKDEATERKFKETMAATRQRMALEFGVKPEPKSEGVGLVARLNLTAALAAKFAAQAPSCVISVGVAAGRPQKLVELPLRTGAVGAARGLRVQVVQIEDELVPAGKDKTPRKLATMVFAQLPELKVVQFHLINRVHGRDAQLASAFYNQRIAAPIASQTINRKAVTLRPPKLWRDGQWVDAPNWLENTTLAVTTVWAEGSFERKITAEKLPLTKSE